MLFEHHNRRGRYGLFEELDDDEDSDDEDLEEPVPEPEMVPRHPCPICGRRNEKVSSSIFSPYI